MPWPLYGEREQREKILRARHRNDETWTITVQSAGKPCVIG